MEIEKKEASMRRSRLWCRSCRAAERVARCVPFGRGVVRLGARTAHRAAFFGREIPEQKMWTCLKSTPSCRQDPHGQGRSRVR